MTVGAYRCVRQVPAILEQWEAVDVVALRTRQRKDLSAYMRLVRLPRAMTTCRCPAAAASPGAMGEGGCMAVTLHAYGCVVLDSVVGGVAGNRDNVADLADTGFGRVAAVPVPAASGVLVERRAVRNLAVLGGDVHEAPDEVDVGDAPVSRVHMSGMAVGALDVLTLLVVIRFYVTVGADIETLRRGSLQVAPEKISVRLCKDAGEAVKGGAA